MDISLNYIEKGQGEPLILLHGNGEDLSYFTHQIDYFSKEYHVIAIDTRGHGKSPRGTTSFTIRQFATDLYEFMKEHKIEKANILGFSDGGNIAIIFAINHPECVNRLIVNGANLTFRGLKQSVQISIIFVYVVTRFFAGVSKKAKKTAELYRLMVKDPAIKAAELMKIQNKTLVIAGTKDMIKESHTKFIYENLKNAKLVIMEGTHFIANEEPEMFNEKVRIFLKED